MCAANLPICCWRSKCTRRCCCISIMCDRLVLTLLQASAAAKKSTRISLARSWSCKFCQGHYRLSIVPLRQESGGVFVFNERLHEPGAERIMGHDYDDGGFEQGRAVLLALARSPATAKHLASKLARHFVADEPPPSLVDGLAKRFRDTDGDLMEVSRMLVTAPEAWDAPPSKLRVPQNGW